MYQQNIRLIFLLVEILVDGHSHLLLLHRQIPLGVPEPELLFQQEHPDAFVVRTLLYLSVAPEIVLSQLLDQLPEIVSVAVQHRHLMALLHPLPCDVVNRRGVPQQIFPLGVWVKCRYDQNLHRFSPAAMDKNASAQGFQL